MGMHQSSVSRIITKVSQELAILRPLYIKMPNRQEQIHIQSRFYDISRFPRAIGCIDGTHFKIQNPGQDDGELFRNRNGYISINAQVCDANLNIMDVVAR